MKRKKNWSYLLFIGGFIIALFLIKKFFPSNADLAKTNYTYESYYQDEKQYDESLAKYQDQEKFSSLAVVSSHHFLAKDDIAKLFSSIKTQDIETVIIVGPDHFNSLKDSETQACTSVNPWRSFATILQTDEALIGKLKKIPGICSDDLVFLNEHSIYTIVPFIKKTFSQVKIVPLVVTNQANDDYFINLGKQIKSMTNHQKTLLVVSTDLAHGVGIEELKKIQQINKQIFFNQDLKNLDQVTSDCKNCLALLFSYLEGQDSTFHLISDNNSFAISGEDSNNVTSYLFVLYER